MRVFIEHCLLILKRPAFNAARDPLKPILQYNTKGPADMQQHRRSRSQTLQTQPSRYPGPGSLSHADEADDEMSTASPTSLGIRSASPIAIAAGRQLRQSPSSSSLVGSLYALGGAVWNMIRGPVETDSADDLVLNGNNNSNNNCTYSNNNNNSGSSNRCSSPALSELSAATSEAPNFEIPFDSNPSSPRAPLPHVFSHSNTSADAIHAADTKRLSVAEPGRGRMTLKTSQSVTRCKLFGRDFPVSEHVLLQSDIESLQTVIPTRWNMFCHWHLLYSTRGHGFSLTTLYNQLKGFKGPILFAVQDDNDELFGAFANQPFACRQGHYGNGETFLWKIDRDHGLLHKYPSTGKNNYFLLSEADYLAVGCGAGKFGLWLDGELLNGTSAPVPTFDNEQLSQTREFQCQGLEVWGLDLEHY